ncbi:MAG TPA: hypothetical protein VGR74_09955, partial [Actinomycetota bacterium]|nr:hypothetical protein [Actinomycetota bacterium]
MIARSYLARWEQRYQDAVRLAGAAESLRQQVGGRAPLEFLAGFLGDPEAATATSVGLTARSLADS